jgi:hypothetical protein
MVNFIQTSTQSGHNLTFSNIAEGAQSLAMTAIVEARRRRFGRGSEKTQHVQETVH